MTSACGDSPKYTKPHAYLAHTAWSPVRAWARPGLTRMLFLALVRRENSYLINLRSLLIRAIAILPSSKGQAVCLRPRPWTSNNSASYASFDSSVAETVVTQPPGLFFLPARLVRGSSLVPLQACKPDLTLPKWLVICCTSSSFKAFPDPTSTSHLFLPPSPPSFDLYIRPQPLPATIGKSLAEHYHLFASSFIRKFTSRGQDG